MSVKSIVFRCLVIVMVIIGMMGCDDEPKDKKTQDGGPDASPTDVVKLPTDTAATSSAVPTDTSGIINLPTDTFVPMATDTERDTGPIYGPFPMVWDFTDDLEGWQAKADSNSGVDAELTHNAVDGYAEVVVNYTDMNQQPDIEYDVPGSDRDWTGAYAMEVTLRTNAFTSGGFQVFMKTGADWDWYAIWVSHGTIGEWITLSLDIEDGVDGGAVDLSFVRSIGVQISSGSDAPASPTTTNVSIDSVRVLGVNPPFDTSLLTDTAVPPTDTAVVEGSDTATATTDVMDAGTDTEAGDTGTDTMDAGVDSGDTDMPTDTASATDTAVDGGVDSGN